MISLNCNCHCSECECSFGEDWLGFGHSRILMGILEKNLRIRHP